MKNPTYYVAIFGKPDPPEKDNVESGRYHLGIRGTGIPGERGGHNVAILHGRLCRTLYVNSWNRHYSNKD